MIKNNYKWTRVRTRNGYAYVKTRNSRPIEFSPTTGLFRVYVLPDNKSHSFETSLVNSTEPTKSIGIQRTPDNHNASVAKQKEADEYTNRVSLTPERFVGMLGASVPLAAGALGATVAAPVVFNKAILPLSDYIASTRAGQLITKGLTNPYFTKGVESAFAAHGINHAVNEGIKGPIDAATTALEIAPLAQPMYKGFQYAADVVPRVARFGVSNHTGNWTQFGNNMYRLKPGYVGMNLPGVERRPISYGYNRESVANAAKEEFMDKTRRPLINRAANEDNTLADALDKVMSGTSETRFGTGNRTMTEPGPHEVLTGTYWDIKTGQPVVRGSGLLGTEPISVTATEGTYKSSGNFGNMSSVTNSPLGGGKYGFRNWNELEDYVLNLGLNESEFNYIADLINRTKSFENGLQLGPRTTQGLIPKKMLRNNEALFRQYLADQAELSDWLMGNMKFGAKNQKVVFSAPKARQIIVGESNDPGFVSRKANIGMPLKSINGDFKYYKSAKVDEQLWPNGLVPEEKMSYYNSLSPTDKIRISIQNDHPQIMFPLHFRGVGPNPFPGMTTMQVKGIRSTFKKGGKIKISAKNLDNLN